MTLRELTVELGFGVVLAVTSQVVVRLTHWDGYFVIITVFIAGYLVRAAMQYWRSSRAHRNEDLPPEQTDTSERMRP